MRSRPAAAAVLVAMLSSGCATGRQLRVHAERGAPLVPEVTASELGPATGLVLVNPVVCLELLRGGGASDGFAAALLLATVVGCAGLLGAVDLVALPVQAVRRSHQQRDLEEIGLACPLDDPAARVGPELAARMIAAYGFSPAPAAAAAAVTASAADSAVPAAAVPAAAVPAAAVPAAAVPAAAGSAAASGSASAAAAAADVAGAGARPGGTAAAAMAAGAGDGARAAGGTAVQLRVRTQRFVRSSRVSWEGHVDFVDPAGQHIWGWSCQSRTPQREAHTFEGECEAARAEIAALADQCVEGVMRVLNQRWPGWGPRAGDVEPESAPEAAVPSMIPGW